MTNEKGEKESLTQRKSLSIIMLYSILEVKCRIK